MPVEVCRLPEQRISLGAGETIWLCGAVLLQVAVGTVSVAGYRMSAEQGVRPVWSPKSSALLCLEASPAGPVELWLRPSREKMPPQISGLFELEPAEGVGEGCFAWIILGEADCPPDATLLRVPPLWRAIGDSLTRSKLQGTPPVILVAGPRKLGKSSLCRYLANRLLSDDDDEGGWSRLAWLDLDPGQTEFTPPAALALALLQPEQLPLGPPLTHQTRLLPLAHLHWLGTASPSECPRSYLAGLQSLERALEQHRGIPVIINTMGWVTGLGLALLQECLCRWRPTHLLAFEAGQQQQQGGTEDWLTAALYQPSSFGPGGSNSRAAYTAENDHQDLPKVVHLTAAGGESLRHPARDQRFYALWAYLLAQLRVGDHGPEGQPTKEQPDQRDQASKVSEKNASLAFQAWHADLALARPFSVGWSQIRLHSVLRLPSSSQHHSSLAALRKSLPLALVGLACAEEHRANGRCHGIGLVRAVDWERQHYHLITPLPLSYLIEHRIDCFLIGNQYLPAAMLQSVYEQHLDGELAAHSWPYLSPIPASALLTHQAGRSTDRRPRGNLQRRHNQ